MSHAVAVQAAGVGLGVAARIDLADFRLEVRHGSTVHAWRPRFMAQVGQRLAYTDQARATTIGFAGWLPYALRRWPEAADKGAFKAFAASRGVPTPAACRDPARIAGPFLVKGRHGSFGEGQRGPFLAHDPAHPGQRLEDGEYYENFLLGHIAKAWCWAGTCLALELQAPDTVVGDGQCSLRRLVEARARGRPVDWLLVSHLAAYCGVHRIDDPVPAGKEVLIEYRYGSRYAIPGRPARNVLSAARPSGLADQFDTAARELGACIPPHLSPALFTLDAVVDGQGRAWFLEMNCNPLVHPHAYAAMLASAFGFDPPAAAGADDHDEMVAI